MRQIIRAALSPTEASYLKTREAAAKRKNLSNSLNIENHWNASRKTKKIGIVVSVLKQMVGLYSPCMYCDDGVGCDVDHFWPKSEYPDKMYLWDNFMLSCPECGRLKGNTFPLENGTPLLINPTEENPWLFLDFDPSTGNIGPRFDTVKNKPLEKGAKTVAILRLDSREPIANRYKRSFRRISKIISDFLESPCDFDKFWKELSEGDDHGLLGWCFDGLGQKETPMRDLISAYPEIAASCVRKLRI